MFKKISFWVIIVFIIIAVIVWFFMNDNNFKANIIVNSISIAVTAGLIDILVNIIPENKRKKTAKNILGKNINWLLFTIEELITSTLLLFEINKTWQNVELDDVSGKNKEPNQLNGNIKYANEIIVNGFSIYDKKTKTKNTGFRQAPIKYNDFIKNNINTIKDYIDKITPFKYFYECDANFVEVITRLRFCDFVRHYEKRDDNRDNLCFILSNTGNTFYEIVEIYRKFILLNYNTEYSISDTLIGNDALEYEKEYLERREMYQSVLRLTNG